MAGDDRSEIAFFDLETTAPTGDGQGYAILEFGGILVCPRKLEELRCFTTLVRPSDPSRISSLSRSNGITKDAVGSAPFFADSADDIYDFLDGRIWAGHNILDFDCKLIRDAFAEINRPPPQPKAFLDTFRLLKKWEFGRRAGDLKMATLATYFGLGPQTHRSLDDVRMNLKVLKYSATLLFLEYNLPYVFKNNNWVSPNPTTSIPTNGKSPIMQTLQNGSMASSSALAENHLTFNMNGLGDNMEEHSSDSDGFLEPHNISASSISTIILAPFYHGLQKIHILHQNSPLQLQCAFLKVRFGISAKYMDYAGLPKLNFVVDAPPNLLQILDEIDSRAKELFDSGSSSYEWCPLVTRKQRFFNSPTIRLNLPTIADAEASRWATEIYEKDSSVVRKLEFSTFDVTQLYSLFTPGRMIDAYISFDTYDYQQKQKAGIRLVAKKLTVHSS